MFVLWTVPCDSVIVQPLEYVICQVFIPLEDVICQVFIPTLIGCAPSCDNLWQLFALPICYGGLGIFIPTRASNSEFAASHRITEPLCLYIHKDFTEALSFQ